MGKSSKDGLIVRLFAIIVFVGLGMILLYKGFLVGNPEGAIVLIYGMACLLVGALVVAFSFAGVFSVPFSRIFYSLEYFDKPQPMYSIPEAREKEGDFDAAFSAYNAILADHPQAVKAYAGMIRVAILELENDPLGHSVFQKGLGVLKCSGDQELLTRHYRESCALADSRKQRAQPNRRISL